MNASWRLNTTRGDALNPLVILSAGGTLLPPESKDRYRREDPTFNLPSSGYSFDRRIDKSFKELFSVSSVPPW
jgi:hypothetical protein